MTRQISTATDPDHTANLAGLCLEVLRARFGNSRGSIRLPQHLSTHALIEFAGKHGAATALAGGIRKVGVDGPYAAGLRLILEAVEQSNTAKNRVMRQTLQEIGQILGQARINCVVLKGGAFIALDPASAGWRTVSDLDLLVSPDQLKQSVKRLSNAGYRTTGSEEFYRQEDHQHFPALVSPAGDVVVELHTRAIWDPGRDPLVTSEVVAHARPVSGLPGILVPSPEHRIIHLIAHCQISDKFYPARRLLLKDVVDFAMLCSQEEIDWQQVDAAYRKIGRLPELTGFLLACRMLLDTTALPIALDLERGRDWANRAIANYHAGTSDRTMMALDIVRDYTGRVLLRRNGIPVLLTTLLNPVRLRSLFNTHYKKWRS